MFVASPESQHQTIVADEYILNKIVETGRFMTKKCLEGYFRDEPFQEIDCTDTDSQTQRNRTAHAGWNTIKQRQKKPALAKTNIKLENAGLVAFYNIRPRSEAGLFS